MPVNHDEIAAIIAHIEAHPEEWDQRHWAIRTDCGTTFCFAGWACVRAGDQFRWGRSFEGPRLSFAMELVSDETIHYRAEKVLGLSDDQAYELFAANNTLDDLKRIAQGFRDSDTPAP